MLGSITGLRGLGSVHPGYPGSLLRPWGDFDVFSSLSGALEHWGSVGCWRVRPLLLFLQVPCKRPPTPVLKLQPVPVPWPAFIVLALQ